MRPAPAETSSRARGYGNPFSAHELVTIGRAHADRIDREVCEGGLASLDPPPASVRRSAASPGLAGPLSLGDVAGPSGTGGGSGRGRRGGAESTIRYRV